MSKFNTPTTVKITSIIEETPTIKTIKFDKTFDFIPGQFIMVWIPGLDEIPISLSGPDQITVKNVGKATEALHKMNKDEYIGLRGPYGNGFSIEGKKILIIGGGVGIAPMKTLAVSKDKDITSIIGAQTKKELFFKEHFPNLHVCTDDGTEGEKALTTQVTERLLKEQKFDAVAACGPEIMLKYLFDICKRHKIATYFSMERWMKCGLGICGHCSIDPSGWRVCKEGPVANSKILDDSEFFKYRRNQSGIKKKI